MPLLMEEHSNPQATEPLARAINHLFLDTIAIPGGLSLLEDYIVATYTRPWDIYN